MPLPCGKLSAVGAERRAASQFESQLVKTRTSQCTDRYRAIARTRASRCQIDLVKHDDDENYFFVDRKKDAVRYKGRNISTFEVELVARKHSAISDCAAFGIQAEELESENEIKLNVILKPGSELSAVELAEFINENAPYFFVPRYIEFVSELPYTPNNKVQKYKLRETGLTDATWDSKQAGFKAVR